jgi:putative FmdB family regulatory protein
MPIYEYRCDKGHNFEVMQRMSDDALTECSICEAPVQRVFHPVAIHFKGSGFYNTDYGKRKRGAAAKEEGGSKGESSSSKDGASSDSSSSSSSKSDSKPDSKPSSSASPGSKSSD